MTMPQFQAPPAAESTDEAPSDPATEPDSTDLSPDELRAELQRARKDAAKYRVQARDLSKRPVLDDDAQRKLAEYDRLEQASKTELERKTEELTRWQGEAEKWRTASVSSQIQALAATDFADPDDAVKALDPAKYLDAGGQIDQAAIKTDLAALLDAKPHYRRSQEPGAPRVPAPNPAQGSGGANGGASDPAAAFAVALNGALGK